MERTVGKTRRTGKSGTVQAASLATRPRAAAVHAPHAVRIIGGRFKRTRLPVADIDGLRPTPDRVRETLFNWIAHLRPDLTAARGLDLFAGAGALGFELASRGAREVVLIERDARLLASLRAVRDKLGATAVRIIGGDALAATAKLADHAFDLIFIDPPFAAGLHEKALTLAQRLAASDGLVSFESAQPLTEAQAAAAGFESIRADRAGRVYFHLLRRRTSG
jgi:16S rRNA (guanine(966)-N(2))-methyltransferase RsmD